MTKPVNVVIVGLGFGAEFIPIYQAHPDANVYGICQRTTEKLNQVGKKFGIEKRFANYADVLKDQNVDYVHINSPIPDHGWMSIEALKAGKHVMCTVPMATTIDECRQICELVQKTGLKYMMAETVVYSREFLFIKDLYQKGELG
ncbi:MAG: Gfo/Idh/MocA family oxidoreductase, partial [Planctomycetes bacterium]|nr:Gfo/Idh/MocA family oxidoreductase [Planctomycetota bacterium]